MLEWETEEVPCNITNMFDNLSLHLIIINRSSKIVEFKIYFAVALKRKIFSDDRSLDPKGIFFKYASLSNNGNCSRVESRSDDVCNCNQ